MKAIILSIGDELLNGQVVNTNASWISSKLHENGIEVIRTLQIRDDLEDILRFMGESMSEADVVIVTGGLGPTRDDITKQALCKYFNDKLILHSPTLEHIQHLFGRKEIQLLESNRRQAEIPSKSRPLTNAIGTAPGLWFEDKGKILVALPGVPFEMERIVEESILPALRDQVGEVFISRTVLTQGMGESMLAHRISDWEERLPAHIKLAYLPQPGIVRLRLTAHGSDREKLVQEINGRFEELDKIIPESIFGHGEDKLEKLVGDLLTEKNMTLSLAESCTGGYLSHLITSVAGSSRYYAGGIVSYSNLLKKDLLGVSASTLDQYGAVSREVVEEMARGARKVSGTDYAIAVSGIAGPDGGTDDKPVGTVWIALSGPSVTFAKKFCFGNHRYRNIRRSALAALNMLRVELMASR